MKTINNSYSELEKGLVFQKTHTISTVEGFGVWSGDKHDDLIKIVKIFNKTFTEEMIKAWGEPGQPGNVLEIKFVVDKMTNLCKELISWEYDLRGINPPNQFKEIIEIMQGWTKPIILEINRFIDTMIKSIPPKDKETTIEFVFSIPSPKGADKIVEIIDSYRKIRR